MAGLEPKGGTFARQGVNPMTAGLVHRTDEGGKMN
jgi:hypothetical protein